MRCWRTELLIVHFRWPLLVGLLTIALSRSLGGFVGATGMALVILGAAGGGFVQWRKEPGLWMLSALFLAMAVILASIIGWGLAQDVLQHGAGPLADLAAADCVLAAFVFAVLAGFMASITRTHWALGREGRAIDGVGEL